MGEFVKVATAAEITPGRMHVRRAKGQNVALSNIGGLIYAIEDRCSHDDGPLGEGALSADVVECPRHGAKFNAKTGEVLSMPAVVSVKSFETKVEGGDVYVNIG